MKQWIDIEGSIQINTSEEEFNQEFLEWLDSKGYVFAGTTKPTEEE